MTEPDLAAAIRLVVDAWTQHNSFEEQLAELENPHELTAKLTQALEEVLTEGGFDLEAGRCTVLGAPFFHLKKVFDVPDLPNTPVEFTPVPDCSCTLNARVSTLIIHGFLGKETVSYGSENDGALFVNLVAMPGEGKFADKSKKGMRGHTDGVSFPFNGDFDNNEARIAPSPDIVTLIGLRNPDAVQTTVMPLNDILGLLSPDDVIELKKAQYSIEAQATFVLGMQEILGEVHVVLDEAVLKDVPPRTIVRYSHSSVAPMEAGGSAQTASENFETACNQVVIYVVIEPGDVLIVSNRLCLHGRGVVGNEIGGQARWLLRAYGLDTSRLAEDQRHLNGQPKHVLYP